MLQGPDINDVVLLTKQFSPPLGPEQLKIQVSPAFVRDTSVISSTEIDHSWTTLKAKKEKILFDGTKFRLHSTHFDTDSDALTLNLAITSYKEHVGTGVLGADLALGGKFSSDKKNYQGVAPHLAQPLGCETLLVTADEKVVFFKRSLAVAEFSGYFCGPGGHPEPQHCDLPAATTDEFGPVQLTALAEGKLLNNGSRSSGSQSASSFTKEFFQSPISEIQQEIGLDPSLCNNLGVVAVVGSFPSLMKPVALFHVATSYTSLQLEEVWKTHKNKEETEGNLLFWSFSDVVHYVMGKQHGEFRFTPTARVSLAYTASILSKDLCITDLTPALQRPSSVSQLRCVLSAQYNRKPSRLDYRMAEVWDAKTKKSQYLFNAMKFRLGGVQTSSEGTVCTIELGMTDYREYVTTNLLPVSEWVGANIDPEPHVSQALGVEALLISSDDQIVLFKRSIHVADFPGFYACPGGHPEPEEIFKRMKLPFDLTTADCHDAHMSALKGQEEAVLAELTRSILMEVSEEIGVHSDDVTMEGFCGVARNELNLGKPDLLYRIRTSKTSSELAQLHQENVAGDSFESEGKLVFFPLARAQAGELPNVPLAPPGLACIRLCAK